LTVTIPVVLGFKVTQILSPKAIPWVAAVETVTTLLSTWAVTTSLKDVSKLWRTPLPASVKYNKPDVVLPTPTPSYPPVVPKPTLVVEIPRRSGVIG